MKRSIIKIRNMKFKYNGIDLFKDIDLDIYEGTFTVIGALSSSGKTTFAKILSGSLIADGYINIDGYLLSDYFIDKIRRNFGICLSHDNDNIIFDTVRDALAFPLESLQYSKKEINVLTDRISKKFQIDNIMDKSFDELNISEKIKVEIASSIIHKPKIILIDDTLEYLNITDKKLILKVLKEYQKENNLTTILLTKNLNYTLYADKVIIINNGVVVTEGSLKEIYKDDSLEKIGFEIPFIIKLSHNLMLYDLLDKVYFTEKEVMDKLWL